MKIECVWEHNGNDSILYFSNISNADSDVIFDTERIAFSVDEYMKLKALTFKSARDLLTLYEAFPDKNRSVLFPRKTFYGDVPNGNKDIWKVENPRYFLL